jgi:hypothetical protein
MARPARKRGDKEYLRKTPVFDLATKYSDEIAEAPFVQRVLRPAVWTGLIVGVGGLVLPACPREVTGTIGTLQDATPTCVTAKPERAAKGGSVKARQVQSSRYERRKERDRLVRFHDAVLFAYAMDWPLTVGVTLSWDALKAAGEHNEGHCLWRDEWDREQYIRNELARLCRTHGLPFVALWGRDVGRMMGSHMHMSMFWPSRKLAELVAVIERISGCSADFVLTPYSANVVARSMCGGWQINMNTRKNDKASAIEWAEYIAAQHAKHPAPPAIKGKAFGISEAIGKMAQKRARPMLEAQEARYRWMKQATLEKP